VSVGENDLKRTADPGATDADQHELTHQFLAQAKEQGIELVGPDRVLYRLPKNVP
jgi:hypothetical protein